MYQTQEVADLVTNSFIPFPVIHLQKRICEVRHDDQFLFATVHVLLEVNRVCPSGLEYTVKMCVERVNSEIFLLNNLNSRVVTAVDGLE